MDSFKRIDMKKEKETRKKLFSFTKELTQSDVSRQQNRLRLIRATIEDELLPNITEWEKAQLNGDGLQVKVMDDDSGKEYDMFLKVWNNGKNFVLSGDGWWRYVTDCNAQAEDVIEVSVFRDFDSE